MGTRGPHDDILEGKHHFSNALERVIQEQAHKVKAKGQVPGWGLAQYAQISSEPFTVTENIKHFLCFPLVSKHEHHRGKAGS